MKTYFEWRKLRKDVKSVVKDARSLVNMRRDLMKQESVDEVENAIRALLDASKAKADIDVVKAKTEKLAGMVETKRPKRNHIMFEIVEVAVVALSVAMAFRAYFFQPFKIPTGSMQPTLYGIHSVQKESSVFDIPGVKILKWAITGSSHKKITVRIPGQIESVNEQSKKPGYKVWRVGSHKFNVPSDVRFQQGYEVRAGETIWEGDVYTGDHVFVNKIIWNFSKAKRDQIMVFKTTGIEGLAQGIFYIKRMVGLPNEEISIIPPYLMINGKRVENCFGISREESQKGLYAGYQLIAPSHQGILKTSQDKIITGDVEYVAMGDNTFNSYDGRYWGTVPLENLVGTQFLVYWPISKRWGWTR
ncbi:MAG: signal peptidase I [Kiritimatiellae bacterium]|jgi:signal peptidase I|nr:signal peptidase I [Kiritimatiellia bacterium]